jgi:hypothetical protein
MVALENLDSEQVKRLQEALRAAGHPTVAADGSLGPQTGEALRRFQADRGLAQTGEPDEETLAALELVGAGSQATPAAAPGEDDRSTSVRAVEGALPGPVTTWAIFDKLLAPHTSYASGVPRDFDLAAPEGAETRTVSEWVGEVRTLFTRQEPGKLDGRKVLFGLALLDRDLRGALGRPFVDALGREIENLPAELSGRGKALHVPDAVPTLSDQPADIDLLGRKAFAEALVSRIRDERSRSHSQKRSLRAREGLQEDCDPDSFMLHLEGPWGSGKSSLLGFMRDELRKEPDPWVVVEFNAWQHQHVGEPLWFLIRDVYRTAVREAGLGGKLRLRWDSFVWRVWVARWRILGFLVSLGVLAGIILWALRTQNGKDHSVEIAGVIAGTLTSAVGAAAALRGLVSSNGSASGAESFRKHASNPMRTLKDRWREIVADAGSPIAIFIDDLDRCKPTFVVDVLEGIQTILRDAPVTFVVAADRRWLYDSYDQVYGEHAASGREAGRPLGHLFLEKTFQLSTAVPRLSLSEQQDYWRSLILGQEGDGVVEAEKLSALEREFRELRTEAEIFAHLDRHAGATHVERRAARAAAVRQLATPELERHTEHTLIRFAPLLESNPRAMKRLVNGYGVERAHQVIGGHSTKLEYPRERLALWTILKARWPLLAEFLGEQPDAIDAIRKGEVPEDVAADTERPYLARLFRDPAVRRAVDGSVVGVPLDRVSLELLLEGPAADEVRHG